MVVFLSFIAVFGFYIFNMAPSLTVGDAGEFQTASAILGIAHAPGYPLFSLFGKISQTIFGAGCLAYRTNILSALMGALTSAFFGLWVYIFLKNFYCRNNNDEEVVTDGAISAVSFFSSIFIASAPSLIHSSVQTEVFTLNSCFAALLTVLIFGTISPGYKNFVWYYLIFFLLGFASANHQTIILILPAILWSVIYNASPRRVVPDFARVLPFLKDVKKVLPLSFIVKSALFFLLGFSVNLYLPARASRSPALNVGNPSDIAGFLRVIRRADYGTLKLTVGQKAGYDLKTLIGQSRRVALGVMRELTSVGALLVLCGLFFMIKNTRTFSEAIFVILFYIFAVPFFIFTGNLPFDAESEGILGRFYVMGNLPIAFLAVAGGVLASDKFFKNKNFSLAVTAVLLAALACFNVRKNFNDYHWRKNFLAYDYGINLLRSIPPGGAFFMDGGDDTFYTTAYLVFAEGRRRDISLFDRGGVVFKSPYGADFRSGLLSREEKELRRKSVERDFATRRPVVFSTFNKDIISPAKVRQAGILYWSPENFRFLRNPSSRDLPDGLFEFYQTRNFTDDFGDYRSRSLQPLYSYMKASYVISDDKSPGESSSHVLAKGMAGFDYCLKRWKDIGWLRTNVKIELSYSAYRFFEKGDYDLSRTVYEYILKNVDPSDASLWTNLGVVYEKSGRPDDALMAYKKAIESNPRHALAYYNSAVIYWKKNDWEKVVENFKSVVSLEPDNAMARAYLMRAETELKRSVKK